MWMAIYGTIVGTTLLWDLGAKYLGPLLAVAELEFMLIGANMPTNGGTTCHGALGPCFPFLLFFFFFF
jgi:hypothetical protein